MMGQVNPTQLDTIVLSTVTTPIETFKVESISSEEITNNDGVILTPILNRIAGVNMQQGALNTNRITIRGVGSRSQFSTNRLKLYVNQVPLTDANGESVLDDFDMNSIGSIEVIKGPKASEYGGNLGGTILFNTRRLINPFNALLGFGSFNRLFVAANGSVELGNTDLQLFYNQIDSDEFRQNSEYERKNLSLFSSTKLNSKWQMDNLFIGTRLKAFIPSSLNQTDFENNPELAARNWFESEGFESYNKFVLGSTWTYNRNEKSSWATTVFLNYRDGYEPRPFDILDEELLGLGLRSVYNTSFNFFNKTFLSQTGLEVQGDKYAVENYDNLYQNTPERGSIQGEVVNAFSQDRLRFNAFSKLNFNFFERLDVEVGLNLNLTTYDTTDEFMEGGVDRSGSLDYSPKLLPNINLAYSATESLAIFANFSQGIATPTSDESLDGEGFFNADLNPSFGNQYELGLQWQPFNKALNVQVNAFQIRIEDLIVARRVEEDRFIGINAGRTDYKGLEFSGEYFGRISDRLNFKLYSSLALYDFRFDEFVDGEDDFSGNRIPAVPEYDLNLGGDLGWNNTLNLGFDWQFVDEMSLNDANSLFSEAYHVLNLRSSYNFEISNVQTSLIFGVNNILDDNFAASVLPNAVGFGNNAPRYFYPSLPRNFYCRLVLLFQ
jgi:iron complex outermembrane receptor protein